MSSLPAARSPSWRWATRSRPGRKPEHDSQNDPQNGQPGLTRKTEKAQWDQLAAGPGVEALLAEHESAFGTSRRFRCRAKVWTLLEAQRTSGAAVGCVGPTRMNPNRTRAGQFCCDAQHSSFSMMW